MRYPFLRLSYIPSYFSSGFIVSHRQPCTQTQYYCALTLCCYLSFSHFSSQFLPRFHFFVLSLTRDALLLFTPSIFLPARVCHSFSLYLYLCLLSIFPLFIYPSSYLTVYFAFRFETRHIGDTFPFEGSVCRKIEITGPFKASQFARKEEKTLIPFMIRLGAEILSAFAVGAPLAPRNFAATQKSVYPTSGYRVWQFMSFCHSRTSKQNLLGQCKGPGSILLNGDQIPLKSPEQIIA